VQPLHVQNGASAVQHGEGFIGPGQEGGGEAQQFGGPLQRTSLAFSRVRHVLPQQTGLRDEQHSSGGAEEGGGAQQFGGPLQRTSMPFLRVRQVLPQQIGLRDVQHLSGLPYLGFFEGLRAVRPARWVGCYGMHHVPTYSSEVWCMPLGTLSIHQPSKRPQ
jgi:hypothetical protein